jgi:alkylation response protein AidB-like acyl-CoA dehydrogenase
MLTEMECRVQACRSLAYRAAALLDGDGGVGRASSLAAQAHGFCDGEAEKVCLDAVQVLGGYGYMKDYGVEKRLRDCKSLQGILGSYVADWLGEE